LSASRCSAHARLPDGFSGAVLSRISGLAPLEVFTPFVSRFSFRFGVCSCLYTTGDDLGESVGVDVARKDHSDLPGGEPGATLTALLRSAVVFMVRARAGSRPRSRLAYLDNLVDQSSHDLEPPLSR
jgi:hypothetical protein